MVNASSSGGPRVVSVSRRTDVPAWYGPWFERRLDAGFAGWENPFSHRRHRVSLARKDVAAFVFWSRDFRPFLPVLARLRAAGYPALFTYTVTGLPRIFEPRAVETEDALDSLAELSALTSPEHVTWRYDPIVLSDLTPPAYHEARFAELCGRLRGRVRRCLFSFVSRYGKVARRFAAFERGHGVTLYDPPLAERVELARRLAAIAAAHDIGLFACCCPELVGGGIGQAHCVDGGLVARLSGGAWRGRARPTRPGCGCAESVDIGAYDTCPCGCLYCYANAGRERAEQAWAAHDPESAFLGRDRHQSAQWLEELREHGDGG